MSLAAQDIFSVAGKVVVITGGGTGIGRMLAEGFVRNGAQVWIVGRREGILVRAKQEVEAEFGKGSEAGGKVGGSLDWVKGDISSKAGCADVISQLSAKVEKVDVLINNAGVQKPWRDPITDHLDPDSSARLLLGVEDEDWSQTEATNVHAPYFLTSLLVPLLRKAADPSVIMIASIAGTGNQRPVSTLTYGVSKAALKHLAAMLAGRLSPLKIRVNTIAPGTFPSEITANPDGTLKEGPAKVAARTPLRRVGLREEILGPALMLASSAGGFMTGAYIAVDGGRNLNAGIDDGIKLPDECYH